MSGEQCLAVKGKVVSSPPPPSFFFFFLSYSQDYKGFFSLLAGYHSLYIFCISSTASCYFSFLHSAKQWFFFFFWRNSMVTWVSALHKSLPLFSHLLSLKVCGVPPLLCGQTKTWSLGASWNWRKPFLFNSYSMCGSEPEEGVVSCQSSQIQCNMKTKQNIHFLHTSLGAPARLLVKVNI